MGILNKKAQNADELPLDKLSGHEQLDVAADMLLAQMPEHESERIKSLANESFMMHRWQLVCGVLSMACEEDRLNNYKFNPGWDSPNAVPEQSHSCEFCGQVFVVKRLGQRFCQNICGVRFNELAIIIGKSFEDAWGLR